MKERSNGHIVAVIDGSTGRGHVIATEFAKSADVERVLFIPGVPALSGEEGKIQVFPTYDGKKIMPTSIKEIVDICKKEGATLAHVAQDNAIQVGVSDVLRNLGIATVGASRDSGKIEWDKVFGRDISKEAGIPVPVYEAFGSIRSAISWLRSKPDIKRAIKAAFLADGKGVLSAKNNKETVSKIKELRKLFPNAAKRFILEEWMTNEDGTPGKEFSAFFITDGTDSWRFIGATQDYKLSDIGDRGENTGSMGGNSPTLLYTQEIRGQTEAIVEKLLTILRERRIPYSGVLYFSGIIIEQNGKKIVKVVEYNSRHGDSEAELIVPVNENFLEVNQASALGDIKNIKVETRDEKRVVIAGASKGYPRNYDDVTGQAVEGISELRKRDDIEVWLAGMNIDAEGNYIADGGRLFHIVGKSKSTFMHARRGAVSAMSTVFINNNGLHFRPDIAWQDIQRERIGS